MKPFPDDQRNQTHNGDYNQGRNEMRSEPIVFLSLVEDDLQGTYPDGQQ